MTDDLMRYDLMAQEALRGVVRMALERAASDEGLPGPHHFYVSFVTKAEGVSIPERLIEEHPVDMTIVFKSHFWDLEIRDDGFSVTMSFDQQPATLVVPYAAVVSFVDPAAKFGLQFPRPQVEETTPSEEQIVSAPAEDGAAEVVSLDAFRKKS